MRSQEVEGVRKQQESGSWELEELGVERVWSGMTQEAKS